MGLIGCPEMSVRSHNGTLCNIPEEHRSHDDDLVIQALVWLCIVQFRAIWFGVVQFGALDTNLR